MQIAVRGRNKKNNLLNKIKKEDGYFTIEAGFLVTILFLLVYAILVIALYLCDLNQAKSFLNERVTELSRDEKEYDQLEEDKSILKNHLFYARIDQFSIKKTEENVEGEVEVSMELPIPIVGEWIGKVWRNRFCLQVNIADSVRELWRWKQVE